MDDALELLDYLPVSLKVPSEQEYVSFLWEVFEINYAGEKYHFAFLAYHLLMMSFVYFNIWQLRDNDLRGFAKQLAQATENQRETLLKSDSPFAFSAINEKRILQLFRLLGCGDDQIATYSALVDDRNNAAHANGNIYFQTKPEIDAKVRQVLEAVEKIQTHSRPIIVGCYEEFLLQNRNPEEWEYLDAEDQIREVLIHGNYMSRKDIEFCVKSDISTLEHKEFDGIKVLHDSLGETYGTENRMSNVL